MKLLLRSPVYFVLLSLTLALPCLQPGTAQADSLTLSAQTGENGLAVVICSSSSTPTASCGSLSALFASATGSLSAGSVGAMASDFAPLPNIFEQTNWVAMAQAGLDYSYTVTGTSAGTIDTFLSVNGATSLVSPVPCAPICSARGEISIPGTERFGASSGSTLPLPTGTFNFEIITPVTGGSADFSFNLIVSAICSPSSPVSANFIGCQGSADYLDPVTITGASVFDANGSRVSGATIVSQSGYSPLKSTPTPEPASLLLLATGLLALAGIARRKLSV